MKNCRRQKLKSFGLIEAVIASVIVIVVLAAAVALSSSSYRSASSDAAYQQAENIAEQMFAQIQTMKSSGNTYFFSEANSPDELARYPVECFDTNVIKTGGTTDAAKKCFDANKYKAGLPFAAWLSQNAYSSDQFDGSYFIIEKTGNPQFGSGYFKIKTSIAKPKDTSRELPRCFSKGTVEIGSDRCRLVKIDVYWSDKTENHYYSDQYITAWEK